MQINRFDLILIFLGIALSSFGAITLKYGAIEIEYNRSAFQIFFQMVLNWKIIIGLLFYFVPALIWIFLLKRIELSFLQPFFSLVYVLTPILAMIFLGESIPLMRWIGISIIIVGLSVTLIN
jgi:drug/metabolite transporter (DMT)-like permease